MALCCPRPAVLTSRAERCARPAPERAAANFCSLGLLGSLVDKSLVVADPAGTGLRYRLLETIRLFAAERLADTGAVRPAKSSHIRR
jgi:predicted ATPase